MATRRSRRRGVALAALPRRIERAQAKAEKALNRGMKATLQMLPPGPRKTVRELGSQLDEAASDLRTRSRKVLRAVERRGGAMAERVEDVVQRAERGGEQVLRQAEREGARWIEVFETGARRVMRAMVARLDVASAHDVAALNRRVAMLERKLTARKRAA